MSSSMKWNLSGIGEVQVSFNGPGSATRPEDSIQRISLWVPVPHGQAVREALGKVAARALSNEISGVPTRMGFIDVREPHMSPIEVWWNEPFPTLTQVRSFLAELPRELR